MAASYKTIKTASQDEYIVKKSRFIGHIMPVTTQEEALDFIAKVSKKHWDATHNVYAYILLDSNIKRYSDDGEPSGTSGIPSLNVLEGEGLFNVCAVITRYFGGTLLGTGGLVRAYSAAVKEAVENSLVVNKCLCNIIKIQCSYSLWGKVKNLLENKNIPVKDVVYANDIVAYIYEKKENTDKLIADITEKTDAVAVISVEGEEYAYTDKDGNVVKIY